MVITALLVVAISLQVAQPQTQKRLTEIRLIIIGVYFPDLPAKGDFNEVTELVKAYVNQYFTEVSYGKISFNISGTGWHELPNQWTDYREYIEDVNKAIDLLYDSLNVSSIKPTPEDIIMIVHTGKGLEFSKRSGIVAFDKIRVEGYGEIRFSIIPYYAPKAGFVYAILRNLGLEDLADDGFSPAGIWTPMGIWKDPDNPPHITMVEKWWLGWIEENEVIEIVRGISLNITLAKATSDDGKKAIYIPLSPAKFYMLEYRRAEEEDFSIPGSGIVISLIDLSVFPAYLGRITIIEKSPLWHGEAFIDVQNQVFIQVLKLNIKEANVLVANGMPDLMISKRLEILGVPLPGEDILIKYKIINIGSLTSPPTLVEVNVNNDVIQLSDIPSLKPAEDIVLEAKFKIPESDPTIKIIINQPKFLIDANMSNNFLDYKLKTIKTIIIDDTRVSNVRASIGSIQRIYFHARYDVGFYDAAGAILYVNGIPYVTNSTGWIEIKDTRINVGLVEYKITKVSQKGIDRFKMLVPHPSIIWDAVEIFDAYSEDERVDVGTYVKITFRLRYAYDKSPFVGSVTINGDIVANRTGTDSYSILWKEDNVTKVEFQVTSVNSPIGINSIVKSDTVSVIWDRIKVKVKAERLRINVGEKPKISLEAYYEFDQRPFEGKIILEPSDPIKLTVGSEKIHVIKVIDSKYGLKSFDANELEIIWDKVLIYLSANVDRFQVNKQAEIVVTAVYAYDGSPFDGKINFNSPLRQTKPGYVTYKVLSIKDNLYGLTEFESNEVTIFFDNLHIEVKPLVWVPGTLIVKVKIMYASDKIQIDQARVLINGFQANLTKSGAYEYRVNLVDVFININVQVFVEGFDKANRTLEVIHLGNLLLMFSLMLSIFGGTYLIRGKLRRKSGKEYEEPYEESIEESPLE